MQANGSKAAYAPVLFLATALLLSLFGLPDQYSPAAEPAPAAGDWLITNTTTLVDSQVTLKGGLIVDSSLELVNTTVIFDITQDGGAGITVKSGGSIFIKTGSKIRSKRSTEKPFFTVYGEAVISDSVVSDLYGSGSGSGGISVDGGRLEVLRSTVTGSAGPGIEIRSGQATIQTSEVCGNNGTGVMVYGGIPQIVDTLICGNGADGVSMAEGATCDILDCEIRDNGGDGIHLESASALISGNRIVGNTGNGVTCSKPKAGLQVIENQIHSNTGWGVFSDGGEGELDSNTYSAGGKSNSLGQVFQAWELSVIVKGVNGAAQEDATVSVENPLGGVSIHLQTNSSGYAVFGTLEGYRIGNDGSLRNMAPYLINASLHKNAGGFLRSKTVTMDQNRFVEFSIVPPDLVVTDLRFSKKEATRGDDVELSAVVTNTGGVGVNDVTVTFYDGSNSIAGETIDRLDPGASQEVAINWDTGEADTGKHRIKVVVDPQDDVLEINETNNELKGNVEVKTSSIFKFAIPLLIIAAVLGIGGYNLYNWFTIRRIRNKQRSEGGGGREMSGGQRRQRPSDEMAKDRGRPPAKSGNDPGSGKDSGNEKKKENRKSNRSGKEKEDRKSNRSGKKKEDRKSNRSGKKKEDRKISGKGKGKKAK